jgi:co-chaperonin GroES (HSP10)
MKLETLQTRVIVKKTPCETKTGLIIIPDEALKNPLTGTVIVVGEDCTMVKVGDKVLYGTYSGSGFTIPEITEEYKDCLLMNEEDILAKIKE